MVDIHEVIRRIQAVSPLISAEPLSGARYAPEPSALSNQCFSNAEDKAQRAGGQVLHGWMFRAGALTMMPTHGCLTAVNHAVWLAPDKKLIDVTPFHSKPEHRPIVVNGDAVIFLVDTNARPFKNNRVGVALPSWFFPLSDDATVVQHVADIAAKELTQWEKEIEAMEDFDDHRRAADLLRARRKKVTQPL